MDYVTHQNYILTASKTWQIERKMCHNATKERGEEERDQDGKDKKKEERKLEENAKEEEERPRR